MCLWDYPWNPIHIITCNERGRQVCFCSSKTTAHTRLKGQIKVLVNQQLNFIQPHKCRDRIAVIDIIIMIIISVNTSFITRFWMAELEVKEKKSKQDRWGKHSTNNKNKQTKKQTNIRMKLELAWRTRPSFQTFLAFI